MRRQLRLALGEPPTFEREAFVVSSANAAAVAAVDAWPDWPGGRLALIGPEGSGKTHLAHIWTRRAGAIILRGEDVDTAALSRVRPGAIVLEDADRGASDEALFHLINMAGLDGASLLITARARPSTWAAALPDLRSRLNGLPLAELPVPDDAILEGVLINLFRERHIRPGDDLIPYLLRRIERSAPRAREVVELLDEASGAEGRGISRALARQILEIDDEGDEPFE